MRFYRYCLFAVSALAFIPSQKSLAQEALPWQQPYAAPANPRMAPAAQLMPPSAPPGVYAPSPDGSSLRDIDDRKLDSLAQDYYHISLKDPRAARKLQTLQQRVRAFRTQLKQRNYDAGDIVQDITRLDRKITAERKKVAANTVAAPKS